MPAGSLRRPGTEYVDVYFDHIWWDSHVEIEAFIAGLAQLKADGKARAVGVSTDDLDYIKHFNRNGDLDVVQLEYSILNRNAEREILPYLAERGIGVVVRGPLQQGLLNVKFSSETTFPDGDVRAEWPAQDWYRTDLDRVERPRVLEADGQTMGKLALRFVLSHRAISVAIPGGKTPEQVAANAAASVRPLLTEDELRLIDEVAPVPA